MSVINAILTKILIVYTVWFFWDWGFYYKNTGVFIALVFLLISLIKDACSNTLPRMICRYSTLVFLSAAVTFFFRGLLVAIDMTGWNVHFTLGVSLFAATVLGIMIGVIESILGPSLSGLSYAWTGNKINWDEELGLSQPQVYAQPAPPICVLPEPHYTTFVPPTSWRFQCPLCGARVPERFGCWNCGGKVQSQPQGPFGPHRPRG